jgi:DNA repair protein RecO (recombination protein O)
LTQQPVRQDGRYTLQAEAGVGESRAEEPAPTGRAWVELQAALEHGSLPALQQACAPVLAEIRPWLRGLIHYHLGSSVLRTRQVMLDVQNL